MRLTRNQIKKIAYKLGLKDIIKVNNTDYQDNAIHEIILECISREKAQFGTSLFDKLYQDYEQVIYSFVGVLR